MKKKLTIAVVSDVLGTENNGTTIAAMNLIRHLQAKGHEVRIVSPDKEKLGLPGCYVTPTINFGIFNKYVKKNGVVIARADKKILREAFEGVDVIHSMLPFSLGKATALLAKELNIPVTSGFHNQAENITAHLKMMNVKRANHLTYKILNKRYYRHVDAIHYPTQFIRDTFEQAVGPTNGYVISNGVNDDFKFRPDLQHTNFIKTDAKYIILFTGRLAKEKTHHVLIKAVQHSNHEKDIQLVFAGAGPFEHKIRHQARHLTHPLIIGFFKRNEMIEVISNATIYVHPAEIEIEAISALEAISCGLVPIIANSNRSATRFFAYDDKNLFKNLDYKDLVRKIDYWLENEDARLKRQAEYLDFTKRFNQTVCMNEMEEMLYEAIENGKKRA